VAALFGVVGAHTVPLIPPASSVAEVRHQSVDRQSDPRRPGPMLLANGTWSRPFAFPHDAGAVRP